jgi:PAS domain S-box-containing protein
VPDRSSFSLEQIREMMNFGPDAMLLIDRNARIYLANSQAEQMFGYPVDTLCGMDMQLLLPERLRAVHQNHYAGFLANPISRKMGKKLNLFALRKDGTEFPVDISLDPTKMTGETLIACFIRDISESIQVELALRESEQTYRALFEYANDAIFLISMEGVHVQVNQKAADLLGYTREELVGMDIKEVVAPAEYPNAQDKLIILLSGNMLPLYDRFFRKKDGTIFPVEINISLVRDLEGKPKYFQSIVRDITERKIIERNLQRLAYQRQRLLDLSIEMLVTRHIDQAIPKILAALEELLSLDIGFIAWADETTNCLKPAFFFGEEKIIAFLKEQTFPLGKGGIMNQVYHSGKAEMVNDAHLDHWVIHPAGKRAAHEHAIVVPLMVAGERFGVLSILRVRDQPFEQDEFELVQVFVAISSIVIQNARLYTEIEGKIRQIQEQQNELRTLSARLEQVREEERRQLAIELHDRVGQMLSGIKINLQIIRRQLPANTMQAVHQRIDDSMKLLEETTILVRNVMADLRPPMLDDYGLVAALKWYAQDYSKRTGIQIQVKGDELVPRLPEKVEIILFRIAQEALYNTARHAQASLVEISLHSSSQMACLSLVDNGVGFDPAQVFSAERRPHWGLLGMQERAASIGGKLTIDSKIGRGTRVVIEIARQGGSQ